MANNDIRWNLELRGEKQVQKGLNDTGDAAEKAADSFDELGGKAAEAGKKTDKAGDGFKDTASDAGHLRREIEATTARVKDLVEQFDKTGDQSLFKDIRGAKRDLGRVTGIAKLIAEPVAAAGPEVSKSLISSLADGFRTGSAALKGAAVPVLAGVAVAAAPAIGAVIAAAVTTGIGAAGIGAGIALAAQNPAVKEAGGALGESLMEAFGASASGFTAPLLKSMEILGDAGRQFAAQLNLNTLAPLVTTLAKGFAGLGQNLLPGLNKALEASKPLLRILANELPGIGSAISDFFASISEESDGAGLALINLLRGLQGTIRFAGDTIAFLSGIYEWAVKAQAAVGGFLEDALGWIPWIGALWGSVNDDAESTLAALQRGKDASHDFAGGVKVIGDSAETTAEKIKALKDGINDLFDVTLDIEQANNAWRRGLLTLREDLEGGSRSLSQYTEAGIANREALLSRVQAAEAIRDADIAAGMAVDQANAKYQKNIDTLQALAAKEGFAKAELDKFLATWRSIPDEATKRFRFQVEVTGGTTLGAAMFRSQERRAEEAAGRRASGGPVAGGKTYWVGEAGPELVTFGQDGFVHNAAASKAMTSGASGGMSMVGAGGGTTHIILTVRGEGEVTQAIAEKMRYEVRTTANGSAEEYFGTGG